MDTGYEQYEILANQPNQPDLADSRDFHALYAEFSFEVEDYLGRIYVSESSFNYILSHQTIQVEGTNTSISETLLYTMTTSFQPQFVLYSQEPSPTDNHIFVDLTTFNKIFGTFFTPNQIVQNQLSLDDYNTHLVSILLSQYNVSTGFYNSMTLEAYVSGIYFFPSMVDPLISYDELLPMEPLIQMNEGELASSQIMMNGFRKVTVFLDESSNANRIFFENLGDDFRHSTYVSEMIYQTEYMANQLSPITSGIAMVLAMISIVFLITMFMQIISSRLRDIGILRSVGVSKGTVYAIFSIQVFTLMSLSYLISSIFVFASVPMLNHSVISNTGYTVVLFSANGYAFALMFGISILAAFISLLVPMITFTKHNPIQLLGMH